MSAERMNNETPAPAWQTAQPEAAPSFDDRVSAEKTDKKSKKKKKDGFAVPIPTVDASTPLADKPESPRPTPLAEILEDTIWQRDKETAGTATDKRQLIIGEKAFAAASQPAEDKPLIMPAPEVQPNQTAGMEPVSKDEKKDGTKETPTMVPDVKMVVAPETAESADTSEQPDIATTPPPFNWQEIMAKLQQQTDVDGAPRFQAQPMIQHAGRDLPPSEHMPQPEEPAERPDMPDVPPPLHEAGTVAHDAAGLERGTAETSDTDRVSSALDYEYMPSPDAPRLPERPAETSSVTSAAMAGSAAAGTAEAVRAAAISHGLYESTIPPGLQRNASEVSKAALGAGLFGWWLGRRGKKKALETVRRQADIAIASADDRARTAETGRLAAERRAKLAGERQPFPRLEAEPMHRYPVPETTGSRTVVQPVSVETHPVGTSASPAERPAGHAAEALLVPVAAAVAAFERVRPHTAAERTEVPRAARFAAARAAERVVSTTRVEAPAAAPGARAERQLGKRELLKVAKDIKVDGVPLKEIFKAKRIDEEGLRAVVDTYLRGGDIRQQLSKEVVMKERSYEMDPMLRRQRLNAERDRQKGSSDRMARVREQAGSAFGQAMVLAGEKGSQMAAATGKGAKKASKAISKGARTAQRDLIDNSNTTDWLSITAVVVLYSIILLLFLGR